MDFVKMFSVLSVLLPPFQVSTFVLCICHLSTARGLGGQALPCCCKAFLTETNCGDQELLRAVLRD